MRPGWNGLDLGRALEAETAKIATTLPLGMSLAKVTDQAVNITQAVDEFMLKFAWRLASCCWSACSASAGVSASSLRRRCH
jgi:multidrug efflux pump subunit AcrB